MDWKPIETAPKDSSEILVYGGYRHAVAYWDEDDEAWVSDYRGKGNGAYVAATHWMPLPNPPEPHYEITAQGRAYLEQMKNEQPNSKDAGQATQGRMAPMGGGEVEPRDEDAA